MSELIEVLTPKQEATFEPTVQEWLAIGLATQQHMDKKEVEEAVSLLYRCGELSPPDKIIYHDNPIQLIPYTYNMQGIVYGHFWSGWLSFYSWFVRTFEEFADVGKLISGNVAIAKACGWVLPFEKECYVTPRPLELHLDTNGNIHHPSQPAIVYPGGYAEYFWHGRTLPEWCFTDPQRITSTIILEEQNAEVRLAMTQIYGLERLLRELSPPVLDRSRWGVLYDMSKIVPQAKMVEWKNSTPTEDGDVSTYLHWADARAQTAKEATAMSFGLEEGEYDPRYES